MGRELQKKKRRSSVAKVTQKPKSKKQVFGNDFIASQWDRSQTLSQNYRRLGLTTKLNKTTGGVEIHRQTANSTSTSSKSRTDHDRLIVNPKQAAIAAASAAKAQKQDSITAGAATAAPATVAEVRVERDPRTGKILRVIESDKGGGDPTTSTARNSKRKLTAAEQVRRPLGASTDDEDEEEEEDEFQGFPDSHASGGHIGSAVSEGQATEVVRRLGEEARALQAAPKKRRKQSDREREWCAALVDKHGPEDYDAMAKDSKLNVFQQSTGDIKKRVGIYLANL